MIARPVRCGLPAFALLLALAACGGTTFDPGASQIEQPPQPSAAPPVATLGGQTYTVVAGDTIDSVARQYGVPVDVLIQANNLASPYQLQAGQQLVIPVSGSYVVRSGDSLYRIALKHNTTVAAIAQINNIAPPYRIKVGQHLTLPGTAVAQNGLSGTTIGDTMPPLTPAPPLPPAGSSVVTTENLAPPSGASAAPAPASSATPGSTASGSTPGSAVVTSSTLPTLAPVNPAAPPSATVTSTAVTTAQTGTMASGFTGGSPVKPVAPGVAGAIPIIPPVSNKGAVGTGANSSGSNPSESVSQSVTNLSTTSQVTSGSAAASGQTVSGAAGSQTASAQPGAASAATTVQPVTHGTGKFLWPVNGKIISPFGPKDGGLHNDGINIAAPLGTPVHAADSGVVVYAGNELRGFGNLLLVRHADGWVSAYAHCDALLVKRGDNVKRGQVIARVGQSGNVNAPQLHFELRKGAEAVDPLAQLGPQGA
jgi:murein DD-endopeptidase MepM/ murein hydrolase activator NlpD